LKGIENVNLISLDDYDFLGYENSERGTGDTSRETK
jgi:hypothetical protein